ncbi:MAG: hypothetical protein GF383_07695 [Candidatus Lokiarchaeota archaeon]|nr:hypothetical protein [Candidatus Lokiarchaeota archaeon]MBD3340154.1 hypothetical protein [Candidatus Lokiarchaeota archaeon]
MENDSTTKFGSRISYLMFVTLAFIFFWGKKLSQITISEVFILFVISAIVGFVVVIIFSVLTRTLIDINAGGIQMILFSYFLLLFFGDISITDLIIGLVVLVYLLALAIVAVIVIIFYFTIYKKYS